MGAKKLIITRLLPKTGQTTRYETDDDGDLQAGWWRGRTLANNKTRFVVIGSGLTAVVNDRATGLMWAADGNGAGCDYGGQNNWSEAIGVAADLTLGGKSDWRLPNVKELMSIVNYSNIISIDDPPFSNTVEGTYWTSTTFAPSTSYAFVVDFAGGLVSIALKTDNTVYIRCVRGGL